MNPLSQQVKDLEDKLDSHIKAFDEYKLALAHTQAVHEEAYRNNMRAITDLTEATKGLVDAWTAANTFHKFVKWLSSFTVLGVAIAWLYTKLHAMKLI